MKQWLAQRRERRANKLYAPVLHRRTQLNDYEEKYLAPGIRQRLQCLQQYCEWICDICVSHANDAALGSLLEGVINPHKIPITGLSGVEIANHYFKQTGSMVEDTYLRPIRAVLARYTAVSSLPELSSFFMEAHAISQSIVQVKDKLLLWSLRGFPYIRTATGDVVVSEPQELLMLLLPFKGAVDNIYGVANSIHENIMNWHQETLKWQTTIVEIGLKRAETSSNATLLLFQVSSTVFAVAISAFFLTAADPFSLKKENMALRGDVQVLQSQNAELRRSPLAMPASTAPQHQTPSPSTTAVAPNLPAIAGTAAP